MKRTDMKLYTWATPNGIKPLIMLEELQTEFELEPVDLGRGDQHTDAYAQINPNEKIPALVDGDVRIFESGAILLYLAEASGRFLPSAASERARALSWLMFQMGAVGPMFGQAFHFKNSAPDNTYGNTRYMAESRRLYGVLERQLSQMDYVAGDYSIADMALFPWCRQPDGFGFSTSELPGVSAWIERMHARPAVARALATKMT